MYVPDNYDQFLLYEAEKERQERILDDENEDEDGVLDRRNIQ